MMKTRPGAIKEAAWFFALTLGICYVILWGPLVVFQVPAISFVDKTVGPIWAVVLYMIGGFVPSLVTLGLTWLWEGKAGLKSMWQRVIQFRIGWRWYLTAVGLVVFGTAGQLLIMRLLGQVFDMRIFLVQLPSLLPLFVIGPLSEELGWRGYAQDRLQTRWNGLVSGLVVGVFWALWHLPLFFLPGTSQHELSMPFFSFFFGVVGQSVLFAWLHNRTQGSIWTAIFYHWVFTYAAQVIASGVTRSPLYNWLEYSPYILLALVVGLIWRGKRGAAGLS
jgi:membrane protease YdiL (CAAX protease family)